ncbi:hypothetical protein [Aureimonas sp. AU4]|uniref:hypothetical protein n=1 Tax=Aureimonas sp. AU4 TaxID=1638163 RepID=UPI0012E37F4D|nr:hypothetical protein [Aureimonas sp. AU4]
MIVEHASLSGAICNPESCSHHVREADEVDQFHVGMIPQNVSDRLRRYVCEAKRASDVLGDRKGKMRNRDRTGSFAPQIVELRKFDPHAFDEPVPQGAVKRNNRPAMSEG